MVASPNENEQVSTREKLILAGLQELNENGIQNFSTRRVASICGVSCAAPYKHFENTQKFISEILGYINGIYFKEQQEVLAKYADSDCKTQLLQVNLHYIRFLVKYPAFHSVITQDFSQMDPEYRALREQLSAGTYSLVKQYCDSVGAPEEVQKRRTFIVRSIIYGAALFFLNRQVEYNEENMKMVESVLEHEMDFF